MTPPEKVTHIVGSFFIENRNVGKSCSEYLGPEGMVQFPLFYQKTHISIALLAVDMPKRIQKHLLMIIM